MRLIDADKLKEEIKEIGCDRFESWDKMLTLAEYETFVGDVIDKAPTVANTDKPLAIINDKVIYMTDGHMNAILEYEHKQAIQLVADQLKRDICAVQEWENDHGKK